MGVTFLIIAPERANELIVDGWELGGEVGDYANTAISKSALDREMNKEKTGVRTPLVALHPITKKELPVFVADYVLGNYGTGVVMGVPAHDERDHAFATKYDLEIIPVIDTGGKEEVPYSGEGVLINSEKFDGLQTEEAKQKITKAAEGESKTTYRLRDWSIGRQRYWGCPIPIVYDPEGNPHMVPEEHLPWTLPTDVDFTPTGVAPLAKSEELKERTEKIFGEGWTPEIETLDTFMDSSWYYYRYLDSKNGESFADKNILKEWMPIDRYSGGSEHTTLHVLYSRFINKALFDLKISPVEEPFRVRMNRGLILGPDGNRMSKSKGNVINPDDLVEKYGADTVKCYLAFIGPYNETGIYPWSPESIAGVRRFLDRAYSLSKKVEDVSDDSESTLELQKTIAKVTQDLPEAKFHTSIAALMSLLNVLEKKDKISKDLYETVLLLLAPFAPHVVQELWEAIGNKGFVSEEKWPIADTSILENASIKLAVQINGKSRGVLEVSPDITENEAIDLIQQDAKIGTYIAEKEIQKVIFVPGRIINILTT